MALSRRESIHDWEKGQRLWSREKPTLGRRNLQGQQDRNPVLMMPPHPRGWQRITSRGNLSKVTGNARRKSAETRGFEDSEEELICGSGECRFSNAARTEPDCVEMEWTHYYQKKIINKDRLDNTGNSTQYSGIIYMRSEKEWIYV